MRVPSLFLSFLLLTETLGRRRRRGGGGGGGGGGDGEERKREGTPIRKGKEREGGGRKWGRMKIGHFIPLLASPLPLPGGPHGEVRGREGDADDGDVKGEREREKGKKSQQIPKKKRISSFFSLSGKLELEKGGRCTYPI